jgi:hypothetical protein
MFVSCSKEGVGEKPNLQCEKTFGQNVKKLDSLFWTNQINKNTYDSLLSQYRIEYNDCNLKIK